MTGLACDDLVVSYPGFRLGPIDLAVAEEVLAVLGPSGGGKSTLLAAIAGLVHAERGSVSLDGRVLDGRPPEDRGTVMLFQDGALFPHLTARENIAYAATDPERVDRLADTLEIAPVLDRRPDALSGGQRQRVALARALAADPDALLLDEPLSDLDAPLARRLRGEMRDLLADARVPVIYVTHDRREATAIGDCVAVLAGGRIHQVGPPREVFERPATPFVARFTGAATVLRVRVRDPGSDAVLTWGPHELVARGCGLPVGTEAWACIRPTHVEIGRPGEPRSGAVIRGRIRRRAYEGETVVLAAAVEAVAEELEVSVPAPAAAELPGEEDVELFVPAAAVHVIGPVDGTDPS